MNESESKKANKYKKIKRQFIKSVIFFPLA